MSYRNFASMTDPDARAFLGLFLTEMSPAISRFATSLGVELTYSSDSLVQVWAAMRPKFSWRQGYAPPPIGQPGPRLLAAQLEPPEDLPSWFHHPSGVGYARFDSETLWLIDGAGRYLGETLIRNVGGCWTSGSTQLEGHMFRNQPVISGIAPRDVSPFQTCAVLVARALTAGVEHGPHSLLDVYTTWSAQRRQP